jgi:hypothetical protein
MKTFVSKKVKVEGALLVIRNLGKNKPYANNSRAYSFSLTINYNGFGIHSKILKEMSYAYKVHDKVWIELDSIDIIYKTKISYNYDPYQQNRFDEHILDTDDNLFDTSFSSMSEK